MRFYPIMRVDLVIESRLLECVTKRCTLWSLTAWILPRVRKVSNGVKPSSFFFVTISLSLFAKFMQNPRVVALKPSSFKILAYFGLVYSLPPIYLVSFRNGTRTHSHRHHHAFLGHGGSVLFLFFVFYYDVFSPPSICRSSWFG